MDPYALIAQIPNAGEAFSQAFQAGMQRNAINALMKNPSDPRALEMYAQFDPKGAFQYSMQQRQSQAEAEKRQREEFTKYAGQLAKWADNPEKWDQAIDYLVQSGHPEAAQLKGRFNPALRQGFMAQAGLQDDKPQSQPNSYEEFQLAQSNPEYAKFLEERRGPLIANNGDGTFTIIPRGSPAPPNAESVPHVTDEASYNAVPPGGKYMTPDGHIRVKGGQAGQTSPAGFP